MKINQDIDITEDPVDDSAVNNFLNDYMIDANSEIVQRTMRVILKLSTVVMIPPVKMMKLTEGIPLRNLSSTKISTRKLLKKQIVGH